MFLNPYILQYKKERKSTRSMLLLCICNPPLFSDKKNEMICLEYKNSYLYICIQ